VAGSLVPVLVSAVAPPVDLHSDAPQALRILRHLLRRVMMMTRSVEAKTKSSDAHRSPRALIESDMRKNVIKGQRNCVRRSCHASISFGL
jgi:hypothetical protein